MKLNNTLKQLSLALLVAALAGCNMTPSRDPAFAPVRPMMPPQSGNDDGAIFIARDEPARTSAFNLFQDSRARNAGDILTIKLVENTSVEKENETVLESDTNISVTAPTIFGVSPKIPGIFTPKEITSRILGEPSGDFNLNTSLASGKDFDGKGESSQSNKVSGEITVSVVRVLANGYLVVRGEKLYTLNRGHEHLRFSGIVRPEDIAADNSVISTRVANARIVYSGEGEVAGAGTLGWLGRFFLSAIFPL